jgi:hypothetical protein
MLGLVCAKVYGFYPGKHIYDCSLGARLGRNCLLFSFYISIPTFRILSFRDYGTRVAKKSVLGRRGCMTSNQLRRVNRKSFWRDYSTSMPFSRCERSRSGLESAPRKAGGGAGEACADEDES